MENCAGAFLANYQFLAKYNRWFNARLYDASERLSQEERSRDRGAFFRSIAGSLNHILWADRLWLRRFVRQGVAFPALSPELLELPDGAIHSTIIYEDWAQLRKAREALDAAIEIWVRDMPDEFPLRSIRYTNTKGLEREHPAWQAMTHFFNHQAHHRGQVTTLLSQAGIDVGLTDIIALV